MQYTVLEGGNLGNATYLHRKDRPAGKKYKTFIDHLTFPQRLQPKQIKTLFSNIFMLRHFHLCKIRLATIEIHLWSRTKCLISIRYIYRISLTPILTFESNKIWGENNFHHYSIYRGPAGNKKHGWGRRIDYWNETYFHLALQWLCCVLHVEVDIFAILIHPRGWCP